MATELRSVLDLDKMTSYKTKEGLDRAMSKLPDELRYIQVMNNSGRYTAIFTNALRLNMHIEVINKGFLVVG